MGATVLTKGGSTALSFDSVLSLHTPAPRKCCVTKARLQTLVFAALFHDLLRLKKPLQASKRELAHTLTPERRTFGK